MPKLRRGRKFDWLYDTWDRLGEFASLARSLDDPDAEAIAEACARNKDHEERAALVCLLTAACIALGQYTAVGDSVGGYLFMPPLSHWAEWAGHEIVRQRFQLQPALELWSNGRLCAAEAILTV